jgi:hypothetical protein
MSAMSDMDAFCDEVEAKVKQDYGYDDGGDLCYNFIESGQVKMSEGVFKAAQTVAQALAQQ